MEVFEAGPAELRDSLPRVLAASDFVCEALCRSPTLAKWLIDGGHLARTLTAGEMAQRLEAALRRPKPAAAAAPAAAEVKPPVRAPRVVVAAPKGSAQPAAQPQNNLEQEMASLLNKPGKT